VAMPDRNTVYQTVKQYFEEHGNRVVVHVALVDPGDVERMYLGAVLGGLINARVNSLEMPSGGLLSCACINEKGELTAVVGLAPEAMHLGGRTANDCLVYAYANFLPPQELDHMRCAVVFTPDEEGG
jgi:hypothetical protein